LYNRHPPDDGLIEAEIADFNGFWQSQYFDTGARALKPVASSAGNAGFLVNQAHLVWGF
jgi:hypothetical protein